MIRQMVFMISLWLPISCFAQFTISGRVLNQAESAPVANASVFLNSATIGTKTAADGSFTLRGIAPGKYHFVISVVGFETFDQAITIVKEDVQLHDVFVFPKTIALAAVTIKPDGNRERNYEWFKQQFLGTSELAAQCKILNPDVLDLGYNSTTGTLTASSAGFLVIENAALGYRVKYLLKNFSFTNKDDADGKILYEGEVLFEELTGTPSKRREWNDTREQVYENSEMHFLRSAIADRMGEEGFRVQLLSVYTNPERPADRLISAKIALFKQQKPNGVNYADSLAWWTKKARLPKTLQKLNRSPLAASEIVSPTSGPGVFALGCSGDQLLVSYNKDHHFSGSGQLTYINDPNSIESTLISFNAPYAYFSANGVISNPYSTVFYGVWARNQVAELLPIDYQPGNLNTAADSTVAKKIKNALEAFSVNHVTEKAYLHFDKPYYAAGDTMYFKAYVTQGDSNKLTNISGVLHVDLINTANKADQSLLLHLVNGVAWGDIALPDSLPTGNYRVRAYTRWMLNDKGQNYYDHPFPIGSIKTPVITEAYAAAPRPVDKPDIQFFPEGGNLVAGINSVIAFKAVDSNGFGIGVKGDVTDSDGKILTTFADAHLGMGSFLFKPAPGKTYKAKMTFANGMASTIDLPAPSTRGIVLNVNNEADDKIMVHITASPEVYTANKDRDLTVMVYSAGIAYPFICKLDNETISLNILKAAMRTGIATITLFSPAGEPLAERLVFIQNHDLMNIAISADKPAYAQREKTTIKFHVDGPDATAAHFSVAVIDEGKAPVPQYSENTILTDLLLTSDLTGFVEQPDHYFSTVGKKTNADLDLVMLTHGYRKFEWKPVLGNTYTLPGIMPETGLEIAGTVKTTDGKLLNKGTVSLLSANGGPVPGTTIDDGGNYHFSNLVFNDSTGFVIRAANNKQKTGRLQPYYAAAASLPVLVNTTPMPDQETTDRMMALYLLNQRLKKGETGRYGPLKGILLDQVVVKQKKDPNNYPTLSLAGAGFADQVVHAEEITGEGLFSDYFNGRLIGVTFIGDQTKVPYLTNPNRLLKAVPMLLVVDGVKTTETVDDINIHDIETVEVLRSSNASSYGAFGLGGVLVITTRRGSNMPGSAALAPGFLTIFPKGFYKAREFYSPQYDHQDNGFKRQDLRSTIYWEPELQMDKDGNASVTYYNADGSNTYRVVIEGIDANGKPGRQVLKYNVN